MTKTLIQKVLFEPFKMQTSPEVCKQRYKQKNKQKMMKQKLEQY